MDLNCLGRVFYWSGDPLTPNESQRFSTGASELVLWIGGQGTAGVVVGCFKHDKLFAGPTGFLNYTLSTEPFGPTGCEFTLPSSLAERLCGGHCSTC